MATVNEKMTALADEIRVLSGTTEPMGLDAMKENISDANEIVDTQADLIAQIASALEGKAGGSGGDSSIDGKYCMFVTFPFDNVSTVTIYIDGVKKKEFDCSGNNPRTAITYLLPGQTVTFSKSSSTDVFAVKDIYGNDIPVYISSTMPVELTYYYHSFEMPNNHVIVYPIVNHTAI